jgi:hypothetical protein
MEVKFKPIGWDVYCYQNGSYENRDFIDCITVIRPHPVESETCVVGFVKGNLTHEFNTDIGKQCLALGFDRMIFSRPSGDNASRYATKTHSNAGLDWYSVDLTIFKEV